jgi:hypothetical protein
VLFGKRRDFMYDLATLKHITEILFKDDRAIYERLAEMTAKKIEVLIGDKYPELSDDLSIMTAFLGTLGLSSNSVAEYKRRLSSYLLHFEEVDLLNEYLAVPAAEKAVRQKITWALRENFPKAGINITDAKWTMLYVSFHAWMKQYSRKLEVYDPATNGIIGSLVHSADFYSKEIPFSLIKELTSTGLNQESEGMDFSPIDFHSENIQSVSDLERFNVLASNICKATDFLYRHNGEVYYDMFSRYKAKIVETQKQNIERELSAIFKYASIHSGTRFYDPNFTVSYSRGADPYKYPRLKMGDRDKILGALDPLIDEGASLKDLNAIFTSMYNANMDVYEKSRGKDQRPVFDYGTYVSKIKMSNDERLECLYKAALSMKELLDYLRNNNINILTVPSDVFRDERLAIRFDTFRKYMDFFSTTSALIKESANVHFQFASNDAIYDDLLINSSNVINNIPLRSIKDVVDSRSSGIKKAPPPVMASNLLDQTLLSEMAGLWNLFYQDKGDNNIASIYCRESVNLSQIEAYFVQSGWITQDLSKWVTNVPKSADEFMPELYGPGSRVEGIQILLNTYRGDNLGSAYLTYLRVIRFIGKFLDMVRDVLYLLYRKPDGSTVNVMSKFRLFLLINENKEIFTLKKPNVSYKDASYFLDKYEVEYYLEEGKELSDMNGHIMLWYKYMYTTFAPLFEYMGKLYEEVHTAYMSGPVPEERELYEVSKDALTKVGVALYYRNATKVINNPRFMKFLASSKVDEMTGLIMRNGSLYRQRHDNEWRYLHEKGYWVTVKNEDFTVKEVSLGDTFGG